MYEHFYGLTEKPFSLLPDSDFLFLGHDHGMAYAVLEYGILRHAGFTVITGEVGCGKTTLIRHMLNHLPETMTVGLISNTDQRFSNLLQWVLRAFGQDYGSADPSAMYYVLLDFLSREYANGNRTLLVIDEAQNLSPGMLEELRTISNINADKKQFLQTILVGQSRLKRTLERPDLSQFAQRIVAHYHIAAFSEEETVQYIRHRLSHAGGKSELFTLEACRKIHHGSQGVPRVINVLCDTALVYGYAEGLDDINAAIVNNVMDDRATGISERIQPAAPGLQAAPLSGHTDKGVQKKGESFSFDRTAAQHLFRHSGKKKT